MQQQTMRRAKHQQKHSRYDVRDIYEKEKNASMFLVVSDVDVVVN